MAILRPYETRKLNIITIGNEATCFLVCILSVVFTDVTDNSKAKNVIGYIVLFLIFANIAVNVSVVIIENILTLRQWIINRRAKG